MEFPRWMYHPDLPKGRIFKTEVELAEAGEGWVDSPALLEMHTEKPSGVKKPDAPKPGRRTTA